MAKTLSLAILNISKMACTVKLCETQNDKMRCLRDRVIFVYEHNNPSRGPVLPLHVAVIQCFCTALASAEVRNSAMQIVKALVDGGADKSVATCNMALCFHDSPPWAWPQSAVYP
jgi:hypothetical protein